MTDDPRRDHEPELGGQVAIVTGAGGALGRSHALTLAALGARVVVNDVGSDVTGAGETAGSAQSVVDEIVQLGGEAIINLDSVTTSAGGQRIVDAAVDAFGSVDILVNNAGILRDVSFQNLTPDVFDAVIRVHVYGTFNVTHAAWGPMKAAGYGRIINTSSGSGIYGNFGQVNYATAKAGIIGMTRALAIEGQRYGILVNAIAPLAASRMSEGVMATELLSRLDPAYVSAIVAFLASGSCSSSGQTFSVGGGYNARVATLEGQGHTFQQIPRLEDIASSFADIQRLGEADELAGLQDQIERVALAIGIEPNRDVPPSHERNGSSDER